MCIRDSDTLPESTLDEPLVDNWMEYLYDIERFEHFAGKKMEKKRNHLNFFNNNYRAAISPITRQDIPDLVEFTHAFSHSHGLQGDLFDYELNATIRMLESYDIFPFLGLVIRIDGHVAGYTVGEKVGDTFFVHTEKGNIEYRGIYQALASAMARCVKEHYPEVRYLNREDDMGIEELRRSKLSYHPSLFVDKRLLR